MWLDTASIKQDAQKKGMNKPFKIWLLKFKKYWKYGRKCWNNFFAKWNRDTVMENMRKG